MMCRGSHSNPQELGTTPWSVLPYSLDFVVECQDMVVNENERSSGVDLPCQGSVIVSSTNTLWTVGGPRTLEPQLRPGTQLAEGQPSMKNPKGRLGDSGNSGRLEGARVMPRGDDGRPLRSSPIIDSRD